MYDKRISRLLIATLVIALLMCIGGVAFAGAKAETGTSPGKITVEYWPNSSDDQWVSPVVKDFEAANPDITIKYSIFTYTIDKMKLAWYIGSFPGLMNRSTYGNPDASRF